MGLKKPFDILIIESPGHYEDLVIEGEGLWVQKEDSLRNLGDLCREHKIPVYLSGSEGKDDYFIRDLFAGCKYLQGLKMEDLKDQGSDGQVKIMISGGYLCYVDDEDLQQIIEIEPNHDQIVNLDKTDDSRRIAILDGCVAARATKIIKYFETIGSMESRIYLDGRSTVDIDNNLNPNLVYLVKKSGNYIPKGQTVEDALPYVVTKTVSRNEIIST
ncbi:hypothetical protein KY366_07985 [Candidatus Woesearchaeota archaeon]|nr:hypothetical protein [Candidatus Woesearchaeota archaeon]